MPVVLGTRANLSTAQVQGDAQREDDPEHEPRLNTDSDDGRYDERAIEVGLIEFVTGSHLNSQVNERQRDLARRGIGQPF